MTVHFCCNYSFACLSNFLPTILETMGYDSINAQGLAAPPYLVSFLCCIAAAIVSDRWGNRGLVITFFASMGTVGYLILTCVENETQTGARYAGVWLATCGIFPALAINITWMLNNQGGESKKGAGMALLAVFGQCSSLVSSSVFPDSDAPLYTKGCALGCAFTGLIVILAVGLHINLALENKRRDRVYGKVNEHDRVDVTDGGDQDPNFRYLTWYAIFSPYYEDASRFLKDSLSSLLLSVLVSISFNSNGGYFPGAIPPRLFSSIREK